MPLIRTPRARAVLALVAAAALSPVLTAGLAPSAVAAPTPTEIDRQVLTTEVADPTTVDVAPDGDVFIAERTGTVKVWRQDGSLVVAGRLPTSFNVRQGVGAGELENGGLHGLLLDQDFATTRRIFLYRSLTKESVNPQTREGLFRLSSFSVRQDDTLDLTSERVLLDVPAEWDHCCHYAGDLHWGEGGTLLLATGDDTSPRDEGWNPRDKRKGREAFNAERTSQNPHDLRGKILRLNPDGTVPADNPHVGDARFNPYVYAMGFRSNYRFSYDPVTRQTFVGNVGPDANAADAARGPQGYDELEVIKPGGGTNHGWPRCIANNKPYREYDYDTGESGDPLSCDGFVPAELFYRNASTDFPLMGAGAGASIMVGPVYRAAGKGALALPDSFQGKLLFGDWGRSFMYSVELDAAGGILENTVAPFSAAATVPFIPVVPEQVSGLLRGPGQPISMAVGPDGALYVAEYGSAYYNNTNSKISRITCAGCRPSSADYLGAPAVLAGAPSDGRAASATPTAWDGPPGVLGVVALAPLALLGLVRRRHVA